MEVVNFIFLFMFGSIIGSFLNVIIYRWPKEESVVFPRSKCPHCNELIPFYFNIPIISWVVLRGKGACCKKPISLMYPFIETLTGLSYVFTIYYFGWTLQGVEMLIFISMAIPCFFIDLKHYLLPDILTLPGIALGFLGSFFVSTRTPLESFFGIILGGGFFWLISWLYEKIKKVEGMGFGDVKLIAWLGALGGFSSVFFIVMVSSFLGLFVGVFLILFKGGGRNTAIPFGPFLITAALIYFIWGTHLVRLFPL